MTHYLKITEEHFRNVLKGIKTFEIRKNDRDFQVGDSLVLRLYKNYKYTGDNITVKITYILKDAFKYGLIPEYAILSFTEIQYEVKRLDI